MTEAESMAALGLENRALRVMLAMTPQSRVLFERLLTGPASMDDLVEALSAERQEPCTERNVYALITRVRRAILGSTFLLRSNEGRKSGQGGPNPHARYILEERA